METVLELKELRGQIVHSMEDNANKIEADLENRADNKWTTAEVEKHDADNKRQNDLLNEIDNRERQDHIGDLLERAKKPESNITFGTSYRQEITREDRNNAMKGFLLAGAGKELRDFHRDSADKCSQHLGSKESSFEKRQWSSGTGSEGGFLHNQGSQFMGIERNQNKFANLRKIAKVEPVDDGLSKHIAYEDSTSVMGSIVAEHGTLTNTDTPMSSVSIESYLFTSNTFPISWQTLYDTSYDVMGLVEEVCAERINRKWNSVMTVGSGSSEPYGFVTEAGTQAAGAAGVLSYNDLIDLMGSVGDYSEGGVFMCNTNTLTALRKLVDGNGRPLFYSANDSLASGFGQTLLGHSLEINNAMADIGTGNKSVAFGDFQKFRVYDSKQINVKVLDQVYAGSGAIGVICHHISAGRLVNSNAVKVLLHP